MVFHGLRLEDPIREHDSGSKDIQVCRMGQESEVYSGRFHRVLGPLVSGPRYDPTLLSTSVSLASSASLSSSSSAVPTPPSPSADTSERQATIDALVQRYTAGFHLLSCTPRNVEPGMGILITGATGSLGSHLVGHLARLPAVATILCLNRTKGKNGEACQLDALQAKGIYLEQAEIAKIHVIQTDTSKPDLGLCPKQIDFVLRHITHIVHNAWPMSISRTIDAFKPQFQTLRNLLDLAAQIVAGRPVSQPVCFQFISSIATVGRYSRRTGQNRVPESRVGADSTLCTGYSEAKLVCEYMLDETLHRFPSHSRAMVVRIGQISGSSTSGYWNPVEHLAFMLKSSQTLRTLPQLEGVRSNQIHFLSFF